MQIPQQTSDNHATVTQLFPVQPVDAAQFVHTLRDIAKANNADKESVRYHRDKVNKTLETPMGCKVEGIYKFTDSERVAIEISMGVDHAALREAQEKARVDAESLRVESALAVPVDAVLSPLANFDPLANVYTPTKYKPTDSQSVLEKFGQAQSLKFRQFTSETNSGLAALAQQAVDQGAMEGAYLSQLKNDARLNAMRQGEADFLASNGLAKEEPSNHAENGAAGNAPNA